MQELAIKRYKNHQVLIAREVKSYVLQVQMEAGSDLGYNSQSESEYGEEDGASLDSDRLEREYSKVVANNSDDISMQGTKYENNTTTLQSQNSLSSLPLTEAQKKFMERKAKFEEEFNQTLDNFKQNMNFLAN